jgi:nitroreductase/Pyruvate/2-oxoacid:ferredoxin oxidoreductase delta subunit
MAWEEVKDILRPQSVHMGKMKVDEEKCQGCGLCVLNCVTRSWEMGDDDIARLREGYSCLSCYNCMVACPEGAISIVEPYRVDDGYWKTIPHSLPAKPPLDPKDADGNPDEWTAIERAILERRSVRNYKDKPVPDTLIRRVLEAGRFAPSSGNCQPWKFIVVKDKAMINEMSDNLSELIGGLYNMYMNDDTVPMLEALVTESPDTPPADPRMIIGGFGPIASREIPVSLGAPVVILIAGDMRAIAGPHMQVGICGQNMCLTANSLGLRSCWVGFFSALEQFPDIKEKLGIESPWTIISGVTLGYPKFKQDGMVPREYRPVTWFRSGWDNPDIEE